MNAKQLSVRLQGEPVGFLEQLLTGKMVFTYLKDTMSPISMGMPIREEPYGELACEAFFGGLLPESNHARKEIARRYGISPNNNFSLLKAIGYDCAGAISFHALDESVVPQKTFELSGRVISDKELYQHIIDLPKKPLFLDVDGLRLSLAGVHDKAAVCIIENQIIFPDKGCPTTYILKPASRDYEGLVENEFFCLKLAERLKLPVPQVEIRRIKDISFLLVERYDRKLHNHQIERIHQEDFCQALGFPPVKKYQNDGGAGFKNCFNLLKQTVQPAVDRNLLASIAVFNFLICNMDAHSKNFSLLQIQPSQFKLAPFYDLVCTGVYPNLATKMAMKIGSKYDIERLQARHWEQWCEDIVYSFPALKNLIKTQGESILNIMADKTQFIPQEIIDDSIFDRIIELIKRHIEKTLKQFS